MRPIVLGFREQESDPAFQHEVAQLFLLGEIGDGELGVGLALVGQLPGGEHVAGNLAGHRADRRADSAFKKLAISSFLLLMRAWPRSNSAAVFASAIGYSLYCVLAKMPASE